MEGSEVHSEQPMATAQLLERLKSEGVHDTAIDDSGDESEGVVQAQRNITQSRIQDRQSTGRIFKEIIDFHWAPMLSPLTEADVDACVSLENAARQNPASADKIEYRIRKCGNVCFGLFNVLDYFEHKEWSLETLQHCRPSHSSQDGLKEARAMFAHFIATLGTSPVVTDQDMALPEHWQDPAACNDSSVGHQISGRTLCLHSAAVCPTVQGIGIGKSALKSYLEIINESAVADRVALICETSVVDFYKPFGFDHLGQSRTSLNADGRWQDMVLDLPGPTIKRQEQAQARATADSGPKAADRVDH